MGTANFGTVGLDWQQRVNWDRLREYRIDRARQMMKKHGLGAMLCMYDENVRYITGTLTPGWNRLKPGLRYAMLCGDGRPILFEQGDLGFQIERHSPWLPKENVRHSFAWIKGAGMRPSKGSYTRSYEQILVVTVGEPGPSATSHMPQRGEERPDFMFCPSVPDHGMWGKPPVNCAEKPTVIAKFFAHDLTPGGPNSNVLVVGSGSGAEIIGALRNGNSVVAFEKNHE